MAFKNIKATGIMLDKGDVHSIVIDKEGRTIAYIPADIRDYFNLEHDDEYYVNIDRVNNQIIINPKKL
jgi:bifunctional DNA-binding transcriptional regulator/antitoxin component of YhaV-PrlF toxin-antitoxin module